MMMIDLLPFCSTEPVRPYLHQPFSHGEHTYATDGIIVVRVPRRSDVPPNPDVPAEKAAGLFDVFAEMPAAVRSFPSAEIPEGAKTECRRCAGRKTMHDCPDCQCTCAICGGAGFTWQFSIGVGDAIFDAKYVRLLALLPGAVMPAAPSPRDAMPCTFDGGEALLMPMSQEHAVHVVADAA